MTGVSILVYPRVVRQYWRRTKNRVLEIVGLKTKMVIDEFFDGREKELLKAVIDGNRLQAEKMLEDGMTFNFRGNEGITPLFWCLLAQDEDALKLSIELGADPNFESSQGIVPLEILIGQDDQELVRYLLEQGANPNATNHHGEPLLFGAIIDNNWPMLKLLLNHGADPDKLSLAGQNSALYAAALNRFEMVYFLLELGADKTVKGENGEDIESLINEVLTDQLLNESDVQFGWLIKVRKLLEQ